MQLYLSGGMIHITALRRIILLIPCSLLYRQTMAQSLGDPIFTEDFGNGTATYAGALPAGTTSYSYVAQAFPNDGSYTVMKSTASSGSVWWSAQDHTGDVSGTHGYMMVVNASISVTDYFYKTTVSNLCPNTSYEFSAWVVNLLRSSDTSPPNITFTIETTGGTILNSYTTGSIPLTSGGPVWKKFGFNFSTPANVTDVVIRMRNNSAGGAPANDLALDDITFRPYGPVIDAGMNTSNSSTLTICADAIQPVNLHASVNSGGYTTPAYQWQVNANNSGWTDIAGATSTSVTVNPNTAGTYQYRLAVGEAANFSNTQCRIVSSALTVTINAVPQVTTASNSPLCVGETLNLTSQGGVSYQWSGPNGFASALQNPTIANITDDNAGTYTVMVTSAAGCKATGQTTVAIGSRPSASVSNNVSICSGSSTVLSASGGVTYQWSPATGLSDASSPNPVASPAATTTYTVSIYDASSACPATKNVTVTVLKPPVANAGPDKSTVQGNGIMLAGSASGDNITYQWSPADYLDNPAKLNPVATPAHDMTYTLTVTSNDGCGISTDQVTVKVYDKVIIPNTFSPNGDGINDVWNITALESYPQASVRVFNRYGNDVFHCTGYPTPWNGQSHNQNLPAGIYYYLIDLKNNTPPLRGWLLITR
ncbi:gliding motility-associated C-terminal domain-containing protein [Pedobacter sp. BS3]|uniref:T9SS type B sorting domain-containing protein n=1 Tax=Pedobacter sp. BS3 TaxID=2567937 RepID=UPI001658D856|nr:gliding motility-associated C-terminal domain-containing protein [Pedobacter sp. BS3]